MAEMSVYGGPVLNESVSAVTTSPSVNLGERRVHKGNEYVYAYNSGGSSIIAEYGAVFITGASGYSVAGTLPTDTAGQLAGLVIHATITTGAYGWIMSRGFSAFNTGNSVMTAEKQPLGPAVGVADKGVAMGVVAANSLGTNAKCGVALDVNTASGGSGYGMFSTGY